MPCKFHLRRLAARVKAGIRAAGGTPIEFNTIAVSDGIAMGTEGMKASLVSREVIADSIELVTRGHLFDALVAIVGCDKTIPGAAMALARLNLPSAMLYGGSILAGQLDGRDLTIQDVFEAVGAFTAGTITADRLRDIENHACPGPGACGGQFTANTMAMAMVFLGLSPMGTASLPAMDAAKDDAAYRSGQVVMDALRAGRTTRTLLTADSPYKLVYTVRIKRLSNAAGWARGPAAAPAAVETERCSVAIGRAGRTPTQFVNRVRGRVRSDRSTNTTTSTIQSKPGSSQSARLAGAGAGGSIGNSRCRRILSRVSMIEDGCNEVLSLLGAARL